MDNINSVPVYLERVKKAVENSDLSPQNKDILSDAFKVQAEYYAHGEPPLQLKDEAVQFFIEKFLDKQKSDSSYLAQSAVVTIVLGQTLDYAIMNGDSSRYFK